MEPQTINSIDAQKQIDNKSQPKPTGHIGGFNTHPENINKNGRPARDWTWKQLLENAMEEALKDGEPVKKFVAKSLVREVLKGNVRAMEVLFDRMDGKPQQSIDHTTLGEKLVTPMHFIPEEKDE